MAKAPATTPPSGPAGKVEVSGNVIFYKNPQPLTREAFADKGVVALERPFDYMADQHFLPITAPEFGAAAAPNSGAVMGRKCWSAM